MTFYLINLKILQGSCIVHAKCEIKREGDDVSNDCDFLSHLLYFQEKDTTTTSSCGSVSSKSYTDEDDEVGSRK